MNIIVSILISSMFLASNIREVASITAINNVGAYSRSDSSKFIPDTSVSGLILENDLLINKELGDLMPLLNDEALPSIYISNIKQTQYLKLIFSPGDSKNQFSAFEIGNITDNTKIIVKKKLNVEEFKTENGIKLGITKRQLINIKGSHFKVIQEGKGTKLRYEIKELKNSSFLRRYNVPLYYAEYFFNNKEELYKYSFGFEYP